jgi:alpha,alpha-trehalase
MADIGEYVISRRDLDAVVFDLDGVITRTVTAHAAAWKRLFDEFLASYSAQGGEDLSPFDIDRDYRRYVDGRPRYQGVRHFLSARHIHLPMGDPSDPPDRETVCGLGNRKNTYFQQTVKEEGVELYGCAVALVKRLRKAGIRTAVVSASKNMELILQRAGIADLFDARVGGIVAERLGLDGKPDPDTFLEAAERLGVDPRRAAVVEDAIAGVMAGRRGRFRLVIGVDRGGQREALREHGAHVVFSDLCRIAVAGTEVEDSYPPPALGGSGIVPDVLRGRRAVLFLDYDGTLTPIVPRPEDAVLAPEMREALAAAAERLPVAVISGRDLPDVRRLVGLPELIYAGSHGFDIEGPDIRLELPEGVDALGDLERAAEALEARLSGIDGAWVERKRFAVTVHYRAVADADAPRVEAAVDAVQRNHSNLRKTGGKKVFELRPDIDWDKGRAVDWLISELGLDRPDTVPLYVGDDVTDEDAFRALRGRGIGILVSDEPRPSAAAFRIDDPEGVRDLLLRLARSPEGDDA